MQFMPSLRQKANTCQTRFGDSDEKGKNVRGNGVVTTTSARSEPKQNEEEEEGRCCRCLGLFTSKVTWCLQVCRWNSRWRVGGQSDAWILKGAERTEEGDGLHALAEAQGCQRGEQGGRQHGEEEEQEQESDKGEDF